MPVADVRADGCLSGEKVYSPRVLGLALTRLWRGPSPEPHGSRFTVGGTVCAFLPCMSIWLAHSVNRRLKTDGRQQAGESRGATSVLDSVSPDPCDGCGSEELEEVSCESTFVEYRCPRCHYRLYRQRLG
jgi:hypothetical protein